ncbi:MAG: hypothetical protein EXS01_01855 [Phycisphaerales bacterium]|nr:hypothetical protein [Phycisphaerales bacterium]
MVIRDEQGIWTVLRETIAAHPEEIFAALTTEVGLIRWFSVAAQVDLRAGGSIVLGWDRKFKRKLTIGIEEFDAGGNIAWNWPSRGDDRFVRIAWTVQPSVEQGSEVVLRMGPVGSDPESLMAMAEDAESWRWYLCNLRTVFEARVDMRTVRPL